jgi:hypothetical protein
MKYHLLICFYFVAFLGLSAQITPVTDTLRANSIHARIQSNGALFLGGQGGYFLVPPTDGALPAVSLLKSAGLWMGGKDANNNIHLAAQLYNENGKTDYYPGLVNSDLTTTNTEFNLVAKVTSNQINAHIANPSDIQASIYGWPARGNAYFSDYYNYDLPFSWAGLAGYLDYNGNDDYNPEQGDYPSIQLRGCNHDRSADEMLWTAFSDAGQHSQSGGLPLNVEVQVQALGFNCPEDSLAARTIYLIYKLQNFNTITLDSCYLGMFLDVEIGNGNDDFIGSIPEEKVVFAYNGDNIDEQGFEGAPPVLGIKLLRGPLDSESGHEITNWHFVTVDESTLTEPNAYYNLMTGKKADGTPFPNNGLLYTGNPLDPTEWSEVSAGNMPGERKTLVSFGPFKFKPGSLNELILGLSWVRKSPNGGVNDNLSILSTSMQGVQDIYDNCFMPPQGCSAAVAVQEQQEQALVPVTPNPFHDQIQIGGNGPALNLVSLWDATGRPVLQRNLNGQSQANLQLADLPSGIYFLRIHCADGSLITHKLVHP